MNNKAIVLWGILICTMYDGVYATHASEHVFNTCVQEDYKHIRALQASINKLGASTVVNHNVRPFVALFNHYHVVGILDEQLRDFLQATTHVKIETLVDSICTAFPQQCNLPKNKYVEQFIQEMLRQEKAISHIRVGQHKVFRSFRLTMPDHVHTPHLVPTTSFDPSAFDITNI